jgi:hypothetical protein
MGFLHFATPQDLVSTGVQVFRSVQGDHVSGKPGKVRALKSGQEIHGNTEGSENMFPIYFKMYSLEQQF